MKKEELGVSSAQERRPQPEAGVGAKPSSNFVLATTYSSGPLKGQPQYFRFMTVIGPAATPNVDEAQRFGTAQEAMQSPGFSHWTSFYEPVEVGEPSQ